MSSFPFLEELYASFNYISDIYDLSYCDNLAVLDLEGNLLAKVDQFRPLKNLKKLEILNIKGNPSSNSPSTQNEIKLLLSNIKSIESGELIPLETQNVANTNQNAENSLISRLISLGLSQDKVEKAMQNYCIEEEQPIEEQVLNGIKNSKPTTDAESVEISDELAVAGNAMNALRTKQRILFANKQECQIDQLIDKFEKESGAFHTNIKTKLCRTSNDFDV